MRELYTVALAGNPNCGKTSLFNALTKMHQSVGNWTGVTVEKKTGLYHKNKRIQIIDLPGIYSLSPYSLEEKIARDYLIKQKPDLIINIIDSLNLERSLNLTLQLLDLGLKVVLALNMKDELQKKNITLDTQKIEDALSVKAVAISAAKKTNLTLLMDIVWKELSTPKEKKLFKYSEELEKEIRKVQKKYNIDRFFAIKLLENDLEIKKTLNLENQDLKLVNLQDQFFLYRNKKAECIASKALNKSLNKSITHKIDKVMTNKYLAFPIFFFIIWLIYFFSVQLAGKYILTLMEGALEELINLIKTRLTLPVWAEGLLTEGVIRGMGTVLSFLPQIVILFFFIALLESSGYMTRVAFIMDRLFYKIGLSGHSFIPMILGCGCSVPAIMSTKTIKDFSQKKMTIILTPFVPCSAKLPVFALFIAAFFPNNSLVAPSMYLLGILTVILVSLILKRTKPFINPKGSFIMELPPYRIPLVTNVFMSIWQKSKDFLTKAGSIILVSSISIWFLSNFNYKLEMVEAKYSLLASIGHLLSPIFIPLGFGDWRAAVAILSGTIAKETIISAFSVLLGASGHNLILSLKEMFSPHAAYSFMAFTLLCFPCVSALAATKKEMGSNKWLLTAMTIQFSTAYAVSYLIYNIGGLVLYNIWFITIPLFFVIVFMVGHFIYKRLYYRR